MTKPAAADMTGEKPCFYCRPHPLLLLLPTGDVCNGGPSHRDTEGLRLRSKGLL
jgi:hypothetical protein